MAALSLTKEVCDLYGSRVFKAFKGSTQDRHEDAKWVEFIKTFSYVIKYKHDKENIVADELSQRHIHKKARQNIEKRT